uniref:Coiled-coil domain-containing protein 25 n=1 Tax=Sphaerodactylus townsendi TaxID=933632 RepID=A0ACB8G9D2_9SAUR
MVFYFTSSVVPSAYTIYMGKDKYENEDLIKYGWPEDVWFHVDKLSSAHVYLRLHKGQTMDDIPKEVLIDCAHLVKANSIQGCKMNNVNVVYTPWTNLKKTADMDVGQIGFHRLKDRGLPNAPVKHAQEKSFVDCIMIDRVVKSEVVRDQAGVEYREWLVSSKG